MQRVDILTRDGHRGYGDSPLKFVTLGPFTSHRYLLPTWSPPESLLWGPRPRTSPELGSTHNPSVPVVGLWVDSCPYTTVSLTCTTHLPDPLGVVPSVFRP